MKDIEIALLLSTESRQIIDGQIASSSLLQQCGSFYYGNSVAGIYAKFFSQSDCQYDALIIDVQEFEDGYELLVKCLTTHFPKLIILLLGDPNKAEFHHSHVTVFDSDRFSIAYLLNSFVCFGRPRSEIKTVDKSAAGEKLRGLSESEMYKSIIEGAGEGIIGLDQNGIINFANVSAGELLCVDPSFLIGQQITDYILDVNCHQLPEEDDASVNGLQHKKVRRSMLVRSNNKTTYIEYTQSVILQADGKAMNVLVIEDIGRRLKAESKLTRLACTDNLTGLYNRFYFEKSLRRELSSRRRGEQKLVLAVVDLDGFKAVNDGFGHGMGDKLLLAVANRLKEITRRGDLVARLGGDEFTLLIKCENHETGNDIGQRVQNGLNIPYIIDGKQLNVTASVGVYEIGDNDKHLSHCLEKADQAMYSVKNRIRNSTPFSRNLRALQKNGPQPMAS